MIEDTAGVGHHYRHFETSTFFSPLFLPVFASKYTDVYASYIMSHPTQSL